MNLALDILFVFLGVILPAFLFITTRRGHKTAAIRWTPRLKVRMYYANGLLLLSLAVVVLIVWYLSGRSFAELGLGWGRQPYDVLAVSILAGFLILYGVDLYGEAGSEERQRDTRLRFRELGFLPTDANQYLHFLFLCVCAGVGEEIVYRGFLITYLTERLGEGGPATAAALLIPAVSFGLAHLYQGGQAVLKIVAMALLFGFFFLRTGSLWTLMLLHTGIDAVGGLLNWYLERK